MSGGEILYFEIDESHTLNEVAKRDMNYEVLCIAAGVLREKFRDKELRKSLKDLFTSSPVPHVYRLC